MTIPNKNLLLIVALFSITLCISAPTEPLAVIAQRRDIIPLSLAPKMIFLKPTHSREESYQDDNPLNTLLHILACERDDALVLQRLLSDLCEEEFKKPNTDADRLEKLKAILGWPELRISQLLNTLNLTTHHKHAELTLYILHLSRASEYPLKYLRWLLIYEKNRRMPNKDIIAALREHVREHSASCCSIL